MGGHANAVAANARSRERLHVPLPGQRNDVLRPGGVHRRRAPVLPLLRFRGQCAAWRWRDLAVADRPGGSERFSACRVEFLDAKGRTAELYALTNHIASTAASVLPALS